jgi:hypothetical protein
MEPTTTAAIGAGRVELRVEMRGWSVGTQFAVVLGKVERRRACGAVHAPDSASC